MVSLSSHVFVTSIVCIRYLFAIFAVRGIVCVFLFFPANFQLVQFLLCRRLPIYPREGCVFVQISEKKWKKKNFWKHKSIADTSTWEFNRNQQKKRGTETFRKVNICMYECINGVAICVNNTPPLRHGDEKKMLTSHTEQHRQEKMVFARIHSHTFCRSVNIRANVCVCCYINLHTHVSI